MKIIHLRPNIAMNWRLYRLMLVKSPSQGFTMLEVLVAILMTFGFLMGTLNAMLAATVMQVKAERQAQATYWIQQNLESVRAAAAAYTDTSGCATSTIATSFNSDSTMPAEASPKPLVGTKSYVMERTETFNNNVLQLTYRVGENDGNGAIASGETSVVATIYTEVIPAAALSCP